MEDSEDLRAIWQSVLHMQQITEDVLDHTKLRMGKLAVRKSDVSVRELLQTVITDKDRSSVPISTHIASNVPDFLWTDRLRMQQVRRRARVASHRRCVCSPGCVPCVSWRPQVLRNALSNAVKFSRSRDPVTINVKRVGGAHSIVPALRIEIRNKVTRRLARLHPRTR